MKETLLGHTFHTQVKSIYIVAQIVQNREIHFLHDTSRHSSHTPPIQHQLQNQIIHNNCQVAVMDMWWVPSGNTLPLWIYFRIYFFLLFNQHCKFGFFFLFFPPISSSSPWPTWLVLSFSLPFVPSFIISLHIWLPVQVIACHSMLGDQ